MSLPVLTAVTGVWEAPLVAGLERSAGQVHVVRRCVDLAELLAAAAAGLGRAAVLSADLDRLDREAVAQLLHVGVAVIGLSDPDDPDSERRLRELGAAPVLSADTSPERVAAAVAEAVGVLLDWHPDQGSEPDQPGLDDPGWSGAGASDPGWNDSGLPGTGLVAADPADALVSVQRAFVTTPSGPGRAGSANGRLVAVWGPTGAPGRTTVALTLGTELAALGAQTLLVDADTYGPSVAQALGLLDESGGIAGAVRSAGQAALDVDRLARLAPSLSGTLRVLTGLPQPSRWPELRPSSLEVLWDRARELAAWTVVDCGFGLEADEELTFDTAAPRRNGATLSALAAADLVIAVGAADPVGLQRLVRGLSHLADVLGPAARPRVVLTRVRASAVGPAPERRVAQALARYAGVQDPLLVPDDRGACDAAMLAGRTLTEVAPSSPARTALAEFAAVLNAGLMIPLAAGRQPALGAGRPG